jgi:hypothetical protein
MARPEEKEEEKSATTAPRTTTTARNRDRRTSEVERKRLHQRREDPRLNGLVVDHRRLVLAVLRVAVGELLTDGAVTDGDGGGAGEDEAGVLDDAGADEDPAKGKVRRRSAGGKKQDHHVVGMQGRRGRE